MSDFNLEDTESGWWINFKDILIIEKDMKSYWTNGR